MVVRLSSSPDGPRGAYFYQGSQYCATVLHSVKYPFVHLQLAQWSASRADLFPALLCERMGKMHSQGRPHSLAHTKRVIERVFQRPFDEVFEEFDETPIGSGAIAQVCRLFSLIAFDFIKLNRFQGVPSRNEAGSTPTLLLRPKTDS